MISAIPNAPGIEDYRLLTALTAEELNEKVRTYEMLGWSTLGTPYFLHAGRSGVQDVFIQPLVLYLKARDEVRQRPHDLSDNPQ